MSYRKVGWMEQIWYILRWKLRKKGGRGCGQGKT